MRRKQLRIEGLEGRAMMTGNVTAVLNSGSLIVTGDASDNGISITQTAVGAYQISGDATTTINGLTLGTPATITGVTKHFKIDMGNGNDQVQLFELNVPKDLTVNGGAGNDTINLVDMKVGGNAFLNGGTGNDTISLSARDISTPPSPGAFYNKGVKVGNLLAIDGGADTDAVSVSNSNGKFLAINSRAGYDTITKRSIKFTAVLETPSQLTSKLADTVFNAWVKGLS